MLIDLDIINRKSYFDIGNEKSSENKELSNNISLDGKNNTKVLLLQTPCTDDHLSTNNLNNQNNLKKNNAEYWIEKYQKTLMILENECELDRKEAQIVAADEMVLEWMSMYNSTDWRRAIKELMDYGIPNPYYRTKT